MSALGLEIDEFLSEILLQAEHQHEILVGSCQSDAPLTNTQEHILMLLSKESLTNRDLAQRLKVSQPAVTKAVKALVAQDLLEPFRDERDARVVYYGLTDKALPIAEEHSHHHAHTLATYEKIAEQFSQVEQESIRRFLKILVGKIGK